MSTTPARRDAYLRTPLQADVVDAPLDWPSDHPIDVLVDPVLPDDSDRWPITSDFGRLMARQIADRTAPSVLEFGAGTSSLVAATALAHVGGRLTSLEQDPAWCQDLWTRVQSLGVDAELVPVVPRLTVNRLGVIHQFDADEVLLRRGPFDLVIIDAPQRWLGRDGALPLIAPHLAAGAVLLLDDAGRSEERWTLYRWLHTYPTLDLVGYDRTFGGRGVAVLRWNGPGRARVHPIGWLASVVERLNQRARVVVRLVRARWRDST